MGGQHKSRSETAILAHKLWKYDGIQTAGHTGGDHCIKQSIVQAEKIKKTEGNCGEYSKPDKGKDVERFPLQKGLDGKGGKADSHQ